VSELARFEALLAAALTAPNPVAALRAAARSAELSPDLRARLAGADPDGVGISALLVVRLRFERLLNGSRAAAEWFEHDPAEFAAAFKRYHTSVPPCAFLPSAEARAFDAWRGGAGQDAGGPP
jgi:hypothetical protein